MRQAPQQIEVRAAALVAARPQPDVIGEQQRHPAFALAREHQERFLVGAVHHDRAVRAAGVDQSEPAAPVRWAGVGADQAARHRMPFAEVAQLRAKRHLDGFAARLRRQDLLERRAPNAGLAGVVRPGRDQHGTALLHIARDVVEIDDRQHALASVAVEDDQVKVLDLLLEQLAGRKCNQR